MFNLIQSVLKRKSYFYVLLFSIVIFFILNLPFNLSVLCSYLNEGYFFVYGNYVLDGDWGKTSRGLLFILIYFLVTKIFGFGIYAIIAVHIIQTIMSILIGLVIYGLVLRLINKPIYAGIASVLWFLFLLTPIGGWGGELEYGAMFSLETEYFCVLFSLVSIYFLVIGFNSTTSNKKLFSILSGITAVLSFMFKSSGAVMLLSYFVWFIYLLAFRRKLIQKHLNIFVGLLYGIFLGLLLFSVIVLTFRGGFLEFLKHYFFVGSYSRDFMCSLQGLFDVFIKTMFRDEISFKGLSNFILFILMFIGIILGAIKNTRGIHGAIWLLVGIWSVGSFCSIMAPGEYGSYYYLMIWPSLAIYLAFLQSYTTDRREGKQVFKVLVTFFIPLIVCLRIYVAMPDYIDVVRKSIRLNLFSQQQSFEDPVVTSGNPHRINALKIADSINKIIPNKKETIYIYNFAKEQLPFSPDMYLYIKRIPPTTIVSDKLRHKTNYLRERITKLKSDLSQKPPKVIVIPDRPFIGNAKQDLKLLLEWTRIFLSKHYYLYSKFSYDFDESQLFNVYIRKT